ncbi:tetratricopeptide repeat protein [Paenibacillus sp. Y412MC10]|uniref:tetratricopeptide repeat protein n=1 Tax=Geobacillus sp. (strain Y412MC10) TaxID=481743 RepID=UPI0028CB660C|nr:tetratricopeptide repeat protein [Paenibacillus sp. Y412MC10]
MRDVQYPVLHTERLRLRPLEPENRENVFRLFSNPEVTRFMDIEPLVSLEEADEIIALTRSSGCRYAIFDRDNDTFMGTCGFHCWVKDGERERAEMGYDLCPEYWGSGYMPEALEELMKVGFEVMKLDEIEAHVERDHPRSQKVLRRLGFRENHLRDGHLIVFRAGREDFSGRRTFRNAVTLRQSGNAEQSKGIWLSLLAEHPEHPVILYQTAWTHDVLGLEKEAVPYYEKAISLGLQDDELAGAMLGLGSTYRTLGRYEDAKSLLKQAMEKFPERREFSVFYAMALYNLGEHAAAMEELLGQLAETSADSGIQAYRKAIAFYADKLDQVWD